MSKPIGTTSYIALTLDQLAQYFGPDDLIEVRKKQVTTIAAKRAIENFAPVPSTSKPVEPEVSVEEFKFND